MTDIQLKDFARIQGLKDVAFILVQNSGEGAQADPSVVTSALTTSIRPRIDERGIWFIGMTDTGVLAKAQTPELRFINNTLEWKYTIEDASSYRPLMSMAAQVSAFFGSLSADERIRLYVLHPSDMTADEIALLQQPATEAAALANTATANANAATLAANTAKENADKATAAATTAKENADKATAAATTAKENADKATAAANTATSNAKAATSAAETQTSYAKTQGDYAKTQGDYAKDQGNYAKAEGDKANVATANANTATTNADAAREKAEEVAAHPTYVGNDNYIYEYDLATHQYNKTEKLVKSPAFSIDYNFSSMSELLANQPTGKSDGLLAIINTQDTEDEDNAKLYISKGGRWQYIVDMSGFRGFQGYTPQLSIGNIVVGSNRSDASVTLSENGRDAKNNPKFNVNFRIPSIAFADFTSDQILLLQKPASDKAAEVQQAEDSRVLAENARKEAESTRASSEQTRISNENTRQENEATRKSNETIRQSNEQTRESNEQTRISNEDTRETNETTRLSNEDKRKSNENTRLSNEESRESNEAIRKANETTRESNEESRKSAEITREDNEAIRKSNEQSRVDEENRRVAEVDSLVHRLEEFDVTIFEERLHFLEQNATCIGEIVGEEEEVDDSVFVNLT